MTTRVVLGYYVVRPAQWGYAPPRQAAPHGGALWAAAAGVTIIASAPLSWGVGADYARYLPAPPSARSPAGRRWAGCCRYDGRALHDERPGSQFWYWHGVSPAGAAAVIAGTAVAVMCVSTTAYSGPVATALAGADLSALAGPALAAAVYYTLARKQVTHADLGQPALPDSHRQPLGGPRAARRLTA
jgi:purine-cytosine permease-like protein